MIYNNKVHVSKINCYDPKKIESILPDEIFNNIKSGDKVVIKPNWVMESHKNRKDEWEYIITNPSIITAILNKVLNRLCGKGHISIIDGPMTEASFEKLISLYPVELWQQLASSYGIGLEIIDLRDYEWVTKNGVIVERKILQGDPRGKVLVDLAGESSEFFHHAKSVRGYYGADYDRAETNRAHDGHHNLYSVSRTVIESDVFINVPKLKTHAKAGITCCLKNLVGINTYKNYLPHHSEGSPSQGGDQFSTDNLNARLEGPFISFIKQHVLKYQSIARILSPCKALGLKIFGESCNVVRNGSWYGNDTLWRMILDLNKIVYYSDINGVMGDESNVKTKCYIGVVDAVLAGEGEGPVLSDPIEMEYIICGNNPVAIDVVCAELMGFDSIKIKTIANAFAVNKYKLTAFKHKDIKVKFDSAELSIKDISKDKIVPFRPHFAWKGHIEKQIPL